MSIRIRPGLRRLGVAGVLGLALVSAACAPAGPSTVPPTSAVAPTTAPAVAATPAGTPVAGSQAVPAVLTANTSGNSISLIDATTHQVLETIDVGFPARSVAVTPDGRYAFIVNGASGANAVSVYDLITRSRVSDIPVGHDPMAINMSSDGRSAFVANSGSNDVSILDVPLRTSVGTVAVGPKPIALTSVTVPGATTIYVVDQGGNEVSVIRPSGAPAAGAGAPAAVSPTAMATSA
ncbi:MAG: YncE family protein, partial [Chloroflexota bacterium]